VKDSEISDYADYEEDYSDGKALRIKGSVMEYLPGDLMNLGRHRENVKPARKIFDKLNFVLGTLFIPFFPFILSCVPLLYRLLGIKPFYKCWRKRYIYFHPDIFKVAIFKKGKDFTSTPLGNKPIPLYKRLSAAAAVVHRYWLERLEKRARNIT